MNRDEIMRIADELDASVPKENARVSLQSYGGDLEEAFIVANEDGYLRMGIEFLKAACAPFVPAEKTLGRRPHEIYVDLDYLITEDSDIRFDYFERREDVTIETHEETLMDRLIPSIILGVMLSVLILALIGLVSVVRAIF